MDFKIFNVDFKADEWEVTRVIARVLHQEDEFKPQEGERQLNFKVKLHPREVGARNDGTGILTLPSHKVVWERKTSEPRTDDIVTDWPDVLEME
jgi:RNA-dependent RNA polymerase